MTFEALTYGSVFKKGLGQKPILPILTAPLYHCAKPHLGSNHANTFVCVACRFRTELCVNWDACDRIVCFFAHSKDELRPKTCTCDKCVRDAITGHPPVLPDAEVEVSKPTPHSVYFVRCHCTQETACHHNLPF